MMVIMEKDFDNIRQRQYTQFSKNIIDFVRNMQNLDNGKPGENQGRKATGAKARERKASQLPKDGRIFLWFFTFVNFHPRFG